MIDSDTRKIIREAYKSGDRSVIQTLIAKQAVTEQEAAEAIQNVFDTALDNIRKDGKCCSLEKLIDYVGDDGYFAD